MDKLNLYRQIIQNILTAHSQIKPAYGDIEMGTLFDFVNDCTLIASRRMASEKPSLWGADSD